jgi:hypothetical protein
MTPATRSAKPTDGALRAAKEIDRNPSFIESTAEIIDRETGVRELADNWRTSLPKPAILLKAAAPNSLPKPALRSGITATKLAGKANDARYRMSRRPEVIDAS